MRTAAPRPDTLETALGDLGAALRRAIAALELAELEGLPRHPRLEQSAAALQQASVALARLARLVDGPA